MSWCDKLASTPVVGIKLTPNFQAAEQILSSLSSVLNREVENERAAFTIETMDPFNLTFNTESGFRYSFEPGSISVAFNHRIRAKASSAGPPTMELISRAAPYTDLLELVSGRLIEVLDILQIPSARKMTRVGVVSVTQVDLEDAPPGIVEILHQIGMPLGGQVENFNTSITTKISDDEKSTVRCAHNLTLPEKPETLVTLHLDWMRTFKTPSSASKSNASDALKNAQLDALAYFEKFAEGGLSDVEN